MSVVIRSFGKAVPARRVSNDDLPAELNTSDEWIRSHTGIGARYIVGENETCVSLGVAACKQAIEEAGVNPEEINLLIGATTTPAYIGFPSTVCVMQPEIGASNATCFDVTGACSGFLYAMNNAVGMMELNNWKYALLVGSEILSGIADWKDRSTCVLFGDAAGAVLLEKVDESDLSDSDEKLAGKVGAFVSGSDGTGAKSLYLSNDDGFLKMDGHAVYNFAVGAMTNAVKLVMEKENLQVTITRPAEKGMYEDAVTSASIENIAPYVSPESKNFEVVCKLDEPGERFRPGMFVKVSVAYRTYNQVPVLPVRTKKLDGSFYLYNPDSETVTFVMPEETPTDGNYFIVDEKFADQWFVIDGQNFVFDGQKVKLYEKALEEF